MSIVSSCGSVTYGVAKELTKILKPLVGKSPHHIKSTQDFVEQVRHIPLVPGECLSSYDVSALFTSVPINPALKVIKGLLEKDHTLKDRSVMGVNDIFLLLEFCLKNTYLSFQGQFFEQVEGVAMGSPVSPIVANLYMEDLEQKALSTTSHPPSSGTGLWMTNLSSIRKSINKTSYNTLTVLTLPLSLQWRTTRRMAPSPSWTPLLNLRLMVAYPSLCTGNQLTQTSTYSRIATTTSLPNLVLLTPSPIGPKQCAAILSCSNKERNTSGKLSPNANILSGLWTRWRKDLIGLPVSVLMGLTTKVPQVPLLLPKKLWVRAILSYLTHKVFVKVSKRSVVDMASKLISKVAAPSKTSWSPPRTKTLWSTKLMPFIGINVGTLAVMMST